MTPEENLPEEENIPEEPKVNNPWFRKPRILLFSAIAFIFLLIPLIFLTVSVNKKTVEQNIEEEIDPFSSPYIPDQLIVNFKEAYSESEVRVLKKELESLGIISQEKIFESDNSRLKNYYLLKFKKGTNLKNVKTRLDNLRVFESTGLNYILTIQASPDDSDYKIQWDFEKIKMPSAWDISKGSNSVKVAVVDTGIDYNHRDFSGRSIIKGWDLANNDDDPMDNHGHGTHIAGTIGAVTNNGIGVAGMNWDVTLIAVKVFNGQKGDSIIVAEGIKKAIALGAKVINVSIGADQPCSNMKMYRDAILDARDNGAIVVVAAGNLNADVKNTSPASCEGVINVAATDEGDQKINISNYGEKVHIAAPGERIYSTAPGNRYQSARGTSMAAPHVAGAVALLLSLRPELTFDQVKSCLISNGDTIVTDQPIGKRLNVFRTLNACSGLAPITPSPTSTPSPSSTPTPGVPTSTPTPSPTPTPIGGKIIIKAFVDRNNSGGRPEAGEQGFAGAKIELVDPQTGGIYKNGVTDSNGEVIFSLLSLRPYKIQLFINEQKFSERDIELKESMPYVIGYFPIPLIFTTPSPTVGSISPLPPVVVTPTVKKVMPTPTPVKIYTCSERTGSGTSSSGAISIGSLECVLKK